MKLAFAAISGLILTAALAGCSGSATARPDPPGSSRLALWWNGDGPSIAYPHAWRIYRINSAGSSFSFPLAYLSNRSVSPGAPPGCRLYQSVSQCARGSSAVTIDPATGRANCRPHGTVTACAAHVVRLAPGQAYVTWTEWDGLPVPPPTDAGTQLTVDGHHASTIVRMHGPLLCPPAAQESIVGRVFFTIGSGHAGWYEMDACLRGPGLSTLRDQVLAMFQSLRQIPS